MYGLSGLLSLSPSVQPVMRPNLGPATSAPVPRVTPQGAPPTPSTPPKPPWYQRLAQGLMPVPAGMEGLLSDEDIKRAQKQGLLGISLGLLAQSGPVVGPAPSLGQALAASIQQGRQSFNESLLGGVQGQTLAQQRQALQAVTPPPTNLSPEERADWFLQSVPPLIASGNLDAARAMAELARSTREGAQAGKPQVVQTGDNVTQWVPGKGFVNPAFDPSKPEGPDNPQYVQSVQRGLTDDQKSENAQNRALRAEQIAAMRDAREQNRLKSMTQGFNQRTKDLRERGAIIRQAIQTVTDAQQNPDPQQRRVLTSSAIANFIQAADQKAQLRFQLLEYFKNNIDPSVAGKWNVLKEKALNGTYPDYVYAGMLHHLNNLMAMSQGEYGKQRAAEVKRHPTLDSWLPEADEFFGTELGGSAAGGAHPLDAIFGGTP